MGTERKRHRIAVITIGAVGLLGGFVAWYARPIVSVHRIGIPWQATLLQSHCARARGEVYCTTAWPLTLDPPTYTATLAYEPLTRELLHAERTWNLTDSAAWVHVVDSTRGELARQGWQRLPCDTTVTHFAVADAWRLGAHEVRFYALPGMPVRGMGERYFATVHLLAFGASGCEPRYSVRVLTPAEMAEAARHWLAKQIGF